VERETVLPLYGPDLREFSPVIRDIYARRLGSETAAFAFLSAAETTAPLPCDLAGVPEAVDRIERALDLREPIAVFGHDDPDGITSAAIVIETLETLGGCVDSYIPNRAVEGHGLYPGLVHRFSDQGVRLIVTKDGCTMNRAEVDLAAELGIDVVVTDHHEASEGRPTVSCLVNPKARPGRTDCTDLTGAGVAALVMRELLHRRPDLWGGGNSSWDGAEPPSGEGASAGATATEETAAVTAEGPHGTLPPECTDERFFRVLDLVALGTIADYGDLGGNNRAMVVRGLTAVARGDRPAIGLARRALEIGPPAVLRVEKASRLAAVFASVPSHDGRSPGLDALLGRESWAGDLDDLLRAFLWNEAATLRAVAVVEQLAAPIEARGGPLVVQVTDVAPRALGKAAGRLLERSGRPAAVLQENGARVEGELRGPDDVNLVDILAGIAPRLSSWGGHRQAAGFSAPAAQADEVTDALRTAFAAIPAPRRSPRRAEAVITRRQIDALFSRSLRAAMPFGKGNPTPLFRIDDSRGDPVREADPSDRVATLVHEPEFPERPKGMVPLVSFHARGSGGLRMRFEGWVPRDGAGS
jgi:single-stranded-DNA-specific exonuclease